MSRPESEGVITDELGAHVSVAGGVSKAPERAHDIHSVNVQVFTKQPSRWAEPTLKDAEVEAFREERRARGIRVAVSHDSYLINLATPKPDLWERSLACFKGELERSSRLGLDYVVTHPGNATDKDAEAGIRRNAEAVGRALAEVPGDVVVLLELTAGGGSSVGGSFEQLAAIREAIPEAERGRVGICVDTCHAYSAGYDLVEDYDGVWERFDAVLGLEHLHLLHLNDSRNPLGSRKDRHEHIGEGTLGPEPFRRIMTDERMAEVAKLLETPKGDDMVSEDRRNLARLRGFRAEGP